MATGGRRPHPVWSNFEKNVIAGKNVKAVCKSCKRELQGMPIRMEKHLENCTEYQASKRPRIVENTSECETVQKPKSTQENTLQKFTVKTSKDEVREIGIQLSRAIISSNSPFSLVEDPEFKKYHNLMRPGVPIP